MYLELNEDKFKKAIGLNRVLVALFSSEYCVPCKGMIEDIHELAKEITEANFSVIKREHEPKLFKKYHIMSVPSILFFRNGQVLKQIMGSKKKLKLNEIIKGVINGD